MAKLIGFRVEGLTGVTRALTALGLDVEDFREAFSRISQQAAQVAAGFAPKRTGRLAGDVRGSQTKNRAVVTAGRASVPYAGPINYGWRAHNIEPAHFMQKTDEVMRPRAVDLLEQGANAAIRRRGLY